MGRIKTVPIKRATHRLIEEHAAEFTDDYAKNKEIMRKFVSVDSKKLFNIIAGYVTRLTKKGKEPKRAYIPERKESF